MLLWNDINRFDTSDYAYDISLVNKKVPCLMKDKNNGANSLGLE